MKPFAERVAAMNAMYKLPINDRPTMPEQGTALKRIRGFRKTVRDEVDEGFDIEMSIFRGETPLDTLTEIADWLGDIVVYCRSEALKYGIPLEAVLDIIMDSNESKLGADGQPIYDEHGKFLKGPNYWKPEPKIRDLLAAVLVGQAS
jgi:hypothetical protein